MLKKLIVILAIVTAAPIVACCSSKTTVVEIDSQDQQYPAFTEIEQYLKDLAGRKGALNLDDLREHINEFEQQLTAVAKKSEDKMIHARIAALREKMNAQADRIVAQTAEIFFMQLSADLDVLKRGLDAGCALNDRPKFESWYKEISQWLKKLSAYPAQASQAQELKSSCDHMMERALKTVAQIPAANNQNGIQQLSPSEHDAKSRAARTQTLQLPTVVRKASISSNAQSPSSSLASRSRSPKPSPKAEGKKGRVKLPSVSPRASLPGATSPSARGDNPKKGSTKTGPKKKSAAKKPKK